ncbi:MAG: EAL domain-containing protein, partial [Pseudomonadota bacterium]|nr:EAL domain-containing protein [Pseudomonadota bacterium]
RARRIAEGHRAALPPQPSARLEGPETPDEEVIGGEEVESEAEGSTPRTTEKAHAGTGAPATRAANVRKQEAAPRRPAATARKAPAAVVGGNIDALLLEQVRKAIDANRIELYLQPIVALPQRSVRFYEALTRLRNEAGELMMPRDYLAVAEAAGAMPAIDNVMLYRSVQVLRRLEQRSQARGLYCNLSMQSLLDQDFFPELVSFLDDNRELSQSLFFEFSQQVIDKAGPIELESLGVLAGLGFRFSLDNVTNLDVDFRSLHDKGFRSVKLPSSVFPARMAQAGARIHAADMRAYLERFSLRLIVEKIEDENSLGTVIDHDVKLGQGFLFSEPRAVRPEVFGGQRDVRAA